MSKRERREKEKEEDKGKLDFSWMKEFQGPTTEKKGRKGRH